GAPPRVDIGAFVHNGTYYSAPGFVTFFFLDNETRTYDAQGRPHEIAYGTGTAGLSGGDWAALFETLKPGHPGLAGALWAKHLKPEELTALRALADQYAKVAEPILAGRAKLRQAQAADQVALTQLRTADEEWRAAQQEAAKDPSPANQEALTKA